MAGGRPRSLFRPAGDHGPPSFGTSRAARPGPPAAPSRAAAAIRADEPRRQGVAGTNARSRGRRCRIPGPRPGSQEPYTRDTGPLIPVFPPARAGRSASPRPAVGSQGPVDGESGRPSAGGSVAGRVRATRTRRARGRRAAFVRPRPGRPDRHASIRPARSDDRIARTRSGRNRPGGRRESAHLVAERPGSRRTACGGRLAVRAALIRTRTGPSGLTRPGDEPMISAASGTARRGDAEVQRVGPGRKPSDRGGEVPRSPS